MALFDINGKEISSGSASVSEEIVRTAIINGIVNGEIELPTTTASGTLPLDAIASQTGWLSGVKSSFDAMMADYKSDAVDGIPMFLCADTHGGATIARIPHNYDSRVFSLALGDLCPDYFYTTHIANVKNAVKPITNVITVAGNHDVVVKGTSDERASYYAINDAFKCTNAKHPDNRLYQTSIDNLHGVKYIVVSGYHLNDTGIGMNTSYTNRVGTAQIEWLIEELSRDDGFDIIVCSHEPLGTSLTNRDGGVKDNAGSGYYSGIRSILAARKAHTSGTVTDADGVVHSYDFTGTKTECLCSFHGHLHEELYSQADGWTEYVQRAYSTNVDGCVSWALIDRNAMTLTIYRAGYDNLVLNL